MSQTQNRLSRKLGYSFADPALLETALTHRSVSNTNNERLEFLGDGLLNFVIGQALFKQCQESPEGDLTRLRASLVRESALVEIAREMDLGECLLLGSGEKKSGGHRRKSILADTVEAVLGAIYLDGGFDSARDVILRLYQSRLENLPSAESLKDAKTRLQELLQSVGDALPDYEVLDISGKPHAQTFTVVCRVIRESNNASEVHAQGSSRRRAEQAAAEMMMAILKTKP